MSTLMDFTKELGKRIGSANISDDSRPLEKVGRAAQVVVIILTFNQREKVLSCLSSLSKDDQLPYQVLVWDNGSSDGTVVAVRSEFPKVLIHRHPTNLGVASGRNAAAALATQTFRPTHFLFLDNDIQVKPGFVAALLAAFAGDERIGQAQAKLRFMKDKERLNDGGGCRINYIFGQTRPVGYGELDHGQYDLPRKCIACGGAMMVRTDVFHELGGFDPKFDPFGPEDLDFSLRLSKAGYTALYIPQAVAYHEVNHTFGADYDENYARHKSRHWLLFLQRHASPIQKLGFFAFGMPYLALRIIAREGRTRNLTAVRGLVKGLRDFIRS
jgi:GT2 family glycosyltransferase